MELIRNYSGRAAYQLEVEGKSLLTAGLFTYEAGQYEATLNRWQVCRHWLQAGSRQAFEKIFGPLLVGNRRVRFRWGIDASGTVFWQPWQTHFVLTCEADAGPAVSSDAGYKFVLVTVDQLYLLELASQVAPYQGILSDMARQLGTSVGFTEFALEPTQLKYSLIQCGESSYRFILERLLGLAVNAAGLGNYSLFADGDTLHFHSPGWEGGGEPLRLDYLINPATGASNLKFFDMYGQRLVDGAAGLTAVVTDPLAGVTKLSETDITRVKKFSDRPGDAALASYFYGRHAGQNTLQSELDRAQVLYDQARSSSFELSVVVTNCPSLRVGRLVDLKMSSAGLISGLYQVVATDVAAAGTGVATTARLRRGELKGVQPGKTVQDPTTLSPGQAQPVEVAGPLTSPGTLRLTLRDPG